jgi:hypothetical protein
MNSLPANDKQWAKLEYAESGRKEEQHGASPTACRTHLDGVSRYASDECVRAAPMIKQAQISSGLRPPHVKKRSVMLKIFFLLSSSSGFLHWYGS